MAPLPFGARPSEARFRDRLRFAAAALLLLAVPVGLSAWLASMELDARDRSAMDARLATALRASTAELGARIALADAEARRLANEPAVQQAIVSRRATSLASIVKKTPGLVVAAAGRPLVGNAPDGAIVPTVAVIGRHGRRIGRVGIVVPLDARLLTTIGRRSGAVLLVERNGRVAGGALAPGASLDVHGGEAQTVTLGSNAYRAGATLLPAGAGRLVALLPAAELVLASQERNRNIALAAVATLLTLVLLSEALVPIMRRRVRQRREGEDVESIELVGTALAAAHDRRALLPVILESVVEATGAVGGVLLEGKDEVAVIGDQPALTEPLRLELAGPNGGQAVALLYPPIGGFSELERRRAERLAAQASVAVENARQHAIAKREAMTDPLTGLANRRRFLDQLAAEAKRRSRSGRPVALIAADLDDFKLVNDQHGHQSGDEVLRAFAEVLRMTLREIDVPARIGGEEFAILLPETDAAGAAVVAARLRERVAALRIEVPDGGRLSVTASFGVASCPPVERAEDLSAAADEALYEAKSGGKNRVMEAAG